MPTYLFGGNGVVEPGTTSVGRPSKSSIDSYYLHSKPVTLLEEPKAAIASKPLPKADPAGALISVAVTKAPRKQRVTDIEPASDPANSQVREKQVSNKWAGGNADQTIVGSKPVRALSSGRQFTPSEQQEFLRQYTDKNATIGFIGFGTPTAEMNGLKEQIIQILRGYGYRNIEGNWRFISEFTPPTEVHFGSTGRNAVSFYIPPAE